MIVRYDFQPSVFSKEEYDTKGIEIIHRFNGWKTEENEDGTFYLVFVSKNDVQSYLKTWDNHDALFMGNRKNAKKLIWVDDKICYYDEIHCKYELHFHDFYPKEPNIHLVPRLSDDFPISNKICLTDNPDMIGYVLK
jgi:hypothetical protein